MLTMGLSISGNPCIPFRASSASSARSNTTHAWPRNLNDLRETTSTMGPNCPNTARMHFFRSATGQGEAIAWLHWVE
jgi:hypothetical protein